MKQIFTISAILLLLSANLQVKAQIHYWSITNGTSNNGLDKAIAITSDATCYIYVTGVSEGISTGLDYLTIKYDVDGNKLWEKRYDGGVGDDEPIAIAVDGNGNVYVTGNSTGLGSGYDYLTIKYNSVGDTVWTKRFNNTNTGGNQDDIAVSLYVDATGQYVYVGGYSYNYVSSTSHNDWVVFKYNGSNGSVFSASPGFPITFNSGPDDKLTDMYVDGAGNIYVTGNTRNPTIPNHIGYFATLEFNSSGLQINGNLTAPTGVPKSINVDGSGNVYVWGDQPNYSFEIFKYNSSLGTLWNKHYSVPLLGIQPNNGEYSHDAREIIVTNSGIYVLGNMDVDPGYNIYNYDVWVAKLNLSGDTIWTKRIGGTGEDKGTSMMLDVNGNAYVTGYITNTNGNKDIFINKYATATGNTTPLQLSPYNEIDNLDDAANQIIVTPEKNILVAGYTTGIISQEDFYVRKYVNFIPLADAGVDKITCLNVPVAIGSALTSGYTYQWSPANSLSSATASNPLASPSAPTEYRLTVTGGCATAFDTVAVDTVHCITDIENIPDFAQLVLYPNPATNQLAINLGGLQAEQVSIYNVDGKLVTEAKLPANNRIDISNLPNGVYIAEIKTKEAVAKRRWVKI